MGEQISFEITAAPGFDKQIGELVSMMNYVRTTTLLAVEGLDTRHLDYLHDDKSNSIGGLLSHMASIEFIFQSLTFENKEPDEKAIAQWRPSLELGDLGRKEINGKPLDFYLDRLHKTRELTLAKLTDLNDDWLYEKRELGGQPSNNYFMWFHVFEDELNHRGQIRWLRTRAEESL